MNLNISNFDTHNLRNYISAEFSSSPFAYFSSVSFVMSHGHKRSRNLRCTSRGTLTIISMPFTRMWLYVSNMEYFIPSWCGKRSYAKDNVSWVTLARAILNTCKFNAYLPANREKSLSSFCNIDLPFRCCRPKDPRNRSNRWGRQR